LINYTKSLPIELKSQLFEQNGLKALLKPEYLNHPFVSGNKWWKLKYNLEEAVRNGSTTLLTFGGAYSNHIYATAAAAGELGLNSIGIIRGEETLPLNHTLTFAKKSGMQLHYVSREDYRKKNETSFVQELNDKFGNFYLILEGGTNELAVKGCAEVARQLNDEVDFDYLCLPVGTGGTMAGMIEGLDSSKRILGFSVLKGGEFLEKEIKKFTAKEGNWQLIRDYHFGGYAKSTPELEKFKTGFEKEFNLPLDLIYTAKMMYGIFDLVQKGFFKKGSAILILHTGGLQGRI
jgi:1-aminocyclopropane-1-carboxylate deaminase